MPGRASLFLSRCTLTGKDPQPTLMQYPESRRVYLPGDKAPVIGQVFRNPDLAQALTLIAKDGESAFYKGEIAQAILKTSY